jgi:urease accessory protein UreF
MTDKSAFSDDEWHALTEAPLLITTAMYMAGEHGPISTIKEATASAKAITHPGDRGAANILIGEIVAEANTKESRHEMKEQRGATPEATADAAIAELAGAAAALKKIPTDEALQVREWLVDIAHSIAESAKSVNDTEQATIDKIARALAG